MDIKCPKCETNNHSDSKFCKECAAPLPSQGDSFTKTIETPTKELTTGSIFAGRYKIVEELGQGGMGRIYRALDNELKEEVALKLIKPEIASDKKILERFRNELKLARKIRHRNIGCMYELMEYKGTHFITMEYIPGEDLKSFIKRSRQLSINTAVSISKQVCEGLEEAHNFGIVHRDLKPGNIMINKQGNAQILDFGIARLLQAQRITGEGVMIGTPEYMSPEQAEGKDVDKTSDIYSVGVILYEMLTGKLPFEGDSPLGIAMQHKQKIPQDLGEINPQIPEDLSRAVLKCLEKDQDSRYHSAKELGIELSKIEKNFSSTLKTIPGSDLTTSKGILRRIKKPWAVITIPLAAVAVVAFAILYPKNEKPSPPPEIKKIVVLPFENLGAPEDEYFADGITDSITARLARLQNLGVISRQSAVLYKNSKKSPKEISEELDGVQYILEGTIQREQPNDPTSRVRIIPQLIDVSNNTHLWAETYDDEFKDVFRVQSDIAEHVAKALEVVLLEPERISMAIRPTDTPEAYELYLRSGKYSSYFSNENQIAVELLERAVAIDPEFTLAYVRLSLFHSTAFFTYDQSEIHKTKAKEYSDTALRLEPDLSDAHLALGYYYYRCNRDYELALEEFAMAKKGRPNDTSLLMAEGFIWRRQSKHEKAAENFKRALTLNPRSRAAAEHLGITVSSMGFYSEANKYFDKAIILAPDLPNSYSWQAWNYLAWHGDTRLAREVMERLPEGTDPRGFSLITWRAIYRIEGNYEEALSRIRESPIEILSYQNFVFPKEQLLADIHQAMGNSLQAKADYESAQKILEKEMVKRPDDPRLHISIGLVYAGLGRKQEAIREGQLAVEQIPVSRDHFVGSYFKEYLARIYTLTGEYEAAIDQLEALLAAQTGLVISRELLRIDPIWDPLRGNPRFEELLKDPLSNND